MGLRDAAAEHEVNQRSPAMRRQHNSPQHPTAARFASRRRVSGKSRWADHRVRTRRRMTIRLYWA
jgi:hypothetical protein